MLLHLYFVFFFIRIDLLAIIDIYRKVVSLDNKSSTAYLRLGMLLLRSGDGARAQEAFDAAIRLDKGLASAVPARYRLAPVVPADK